MAYARNSQAISSKKCSKIKAVAILARLVGVLTKERYDKMKICASELVAKKSIRKIAHKSREKIDYPN